MTALFHTLRRLIEETGPLTVAQYMDWALNHPDQGYYQRHDPLGAAGDFVTAPEISQMFGELIGLWCAATWEQMGRPDPVLLVEFGPGRGTLMADALRAGAIVEPFEMARRAHLVETSSVLRHRQEVMLGESGAIWHDDIDGLPAGPALIIANELFDALPVRQLVRGGQGWVERRIGLDRAAKSLCFATDEQPSPVAALLPAALTGAPEGSLVEINPAAAGLAVQLSRRLVDQGGVALIIDYGHVQPRTGETLQAVKGHRPHAVLESPGEADLTAHVDFAVLARVAREAGAHAHGPVPQGRFLERLGIVSRAEALCREATPEQTTEIRAALERLTGENAMGALFKCLAITSPDLPAPAGFGSTAEPGGQRAARA